MEELSCLKSRADQIRSIPVGKTRSFKMESLRDCESMKNSAYRESGFYPETGIKYSVSVDKKTVTVHITATRVP